MVIIGKIIVVNIQKRIVYIPWQMFHGKITCHPYLTMITVLVNQTKGGVYIRIIQFILRMIDSIFPKHLFMFINVYVMTVFRLIHFIKITYVQRQPDSFTVVLVGQFRQNVDEIRRHRLR